ncbi:MAG TPA: hypothetical protein VHO23_00605 [Candidatus Paceibacterota bacterium]|nr:hypothetical protein [Candidatus Paceibacterota bacterium]
MTMHITYTAQRESPSFERVLRRSITTKHTLRPQTGATFRIGWGARHGKASEGGVLKRTTDELAGTRNDANRQS